MTLFEKFESKLEQFSGNLVRSAVELAKDWRTDKNLRRLEALLVVVDAQSSLLISGTGDVVEPDDGLLAIGSRRILRPGRSQGPVRPFRSFRRGQSPAKPCVSPRKSASIPTKI